MQIRIQVRVKLQLDPDKENFQKYFFNKYHSSLCCGKSQKNKIHFLSSYFSSSSTTLRTGFIFDFLPTGSGILHADTDPDPGGLP